MNPNLFRRYKKGENKILKSIQEQSIFTYDDIEKVYDRVNSYDLTIKCIELAAAVACHPLRIADFVVDLYK